MNTDSRGRTMKMKAVSSLVVGVLLLFGSCTQPTEVDRDNRRLLDAIITALSMGNDKWLADDEQLLQTRHKAGQLTDEDFQKLTMVIGQARGGDWSGAVQAGYQFREKRPFVREGH